MDQLIHLVGQILFGGFFIMSGYKHFAYHKNMVAYATSKGVPSPGTVVYATGLLIFLGGIGVIFNIQPEWSARLIALFLLVITPKMHAYWKETDPGAKMAEQVNFGKNVALLGASLMFAF